MINISKHITYYCKEDTDSNDCNELFEINDKSNFTYQFIIIEDFYKNPNLVRDYAIHSYDYAYDYKYGKRSKSSYLNNNIINLLIEYLNKLKVITYENDNSVSGSFLYSDYSNIKFIHTDDTNIKNNEEAWAAVIYMNELEETIYGTSFYVLMENSLSKFSVFTQNMDREHDNLKKYIECDSIGNKFNKLLLYNGSINHSLRRIFGNNKYNCRISQTFFFNSTSVNK